MSIKNVRPTLFQLPFFFSRPSSELWLGDLHEVVWGRDERGRPCDARRGLHFVAGEHPHPYARTAEDLEAVADVLLQGGGWMNERKDEEERKKEEEKEKKEYKYKHKKVD